MTRFRLRIFVRNITDTSLYSFQCILSVSTWFSLVPLLMIITLITSIKAVSTRHPEGGHGNPLQYSCLENPMDRGARWAAVRRVAKSPTRLRRHQQLQGTSVWNNASPLSLVSSLCRDAWNYVNIPFLPQFTHQFNLLDGRVCLQRRRPGFDPCIGKIPWRRKWQPTPVSLPGKFHGRRSLAGYPPWGRKESDMTERLHLTSYKLTLIFIMC